MNSVQGNRGDLVSLFDEARLSSVESPPGINSQFHTRNPRSLNSRGANYKRYLDSISKEKGVMLRLGVKDKGQERYNTRV